MNRVAYPVNEKTQKMLDVLYASFCCQVEHLRMLEAELLKQWESNHAARCGGTLPHAVGTKCHWPVPKVLEVVLAKPLGERLGFAPMGLELNR